MVDENEANVLQALMNVSPGPIEPKGLFFLEEISRWSEANFNAKWGEPEFIPACTLICWGCRDDIFRNKSFKLRKTILKDVETDLTQSRIDVVSSSLASQVPKAPSTAQLLLRFQSQAWDEFIRSTLPSGQSRSQITPQMKETAIANASEEDKLRVIARSLDLLKDSIKHNPSSSSSEQQDTAAASTA